MTVEVTGKEQQLITMLKTEIKAGMVLHVRSCQDIAWNNSRRGVLEMLDKYSHGNGLFQQETKDDV